MAYINNPKLRIELGANDSAKVFVDYTINWGDFDKQTNIGYWEEVTLWGQDDDSADDKLKLLGNFDAYSNGEDTLTRSREFDLKRSQLNEDSLPGDDDEIYVRVIMQDKENIMKPLKAVSNHVVLGD